MNKSVVLPKEQSLPCHCLPVKGNTYTVVIDPVLSGLFVHEALGHLQKQTCENPDLLGNEHQASVWTRKLPNFLMKIGCQRTSRQLLLTTMKAPATTTQLIKDGVLVGTPPFRETAGKLGEAPTGNAVSTTTMLIVHA